MTDCTIVIPVHDGADLTRRCLDTLRAQDLGGAEIVVVDDASTDETAALLAARDDVRVLRHERGLGFATSCNSGVAASSGRHVVLLNNDTQPCDGWLDALLRYADAHPHAAVVGAKLLWPDDTVQHAGVAISQSRDVRHIYAGLPGDHPAVCRSRRYAIVTGACMLVRREVFEELDGFDTAFVNGYEDVDFCLRAGERGHEVHYCHEAVVYHLASSSRGDDPDHDDHNRDLYRLRWADRVLPDDVERYLEDGLLEVSYAHDAVKVSVDPALGGVSDGARSADLAAVAAMRAAQVFELQRENARLARAVGWSPGRAPVDADESEPETAREATVVVAVGHDEPVDALLAALARQTVAPGSFDVLLVHPQRAVPYEVEAGSLPVRQIASGTPGGRAAAFNRGIQAARSELVVLLADDLIPGPGFLAAHRAVHEADPGEHVVGIGPAIFPNRLRDLEFRRWIEDSGQLFGVSFTAGDPPPPSFFWCANTSAKRAFLLADGMFDERLSLSAWEDYELGRRLADRGMRSRFVPGAVAVHEHPLTLAERRDVMHDAGVSAARFDGLYPPGHPWNTGTDARTRTALVEARAQAARLRHRLTGRPAHAHAYFEGTLRAAFLRGYRGEARRLAAGGLL